MNIKVRLATLAYTSMAQGSDTDGSGRQEYSKNSTQCARYTTQYII